MEPLKNDLEQQLHAAQLGETPSEDFMKQLLASHVFMPVKDDGAISGIQRSTHAQPLVVQDDDGVSALVLFTSPERAKPFLEHYPEFKGGLLTEFTWVLEKMDEGHAARHIRQFNAVAPRFRLIAALTRAPYPAPVRRPG